MNKKTDHHSRRTIPKGINMKKLAIVLLTVMLFTFPSKALADVAPPINPPGSNPQPGTESTQVRMMAETVLIDVQNDGRLGSATITADFTMRNLGSDPESMAVRFPISANDGRGEYPEITNFTVSVAGTQIQYRRTSYPDVEDASQTVPWAEFDITFPVGQDVPIQVKYKLRGSGYAPYTAFYYILESGAGWKDTIGSADIILRLPYEATPQNVIMDFQIGWAETTPSGSFEGNEVRWHFEDFEPGLYQVIQNMEFALVAPTAWQKVLEDRANAAKYPNDSEVWGQLGKAYKSIVLMSRYYRTDEGGEALYQLSIDAYEKCLSLNPNDAQWHAGFAELLAYHSFVDSLNGIVEPDAVRALDEIRIALALSPFDDTVRSIADTIYFMFPQGMSQTESGYDFPWLTQTPTALPPTPTIVPVYDPETLAGTYQSETITLANNKQAVLKLTLRADYSAEMENKGADEVVISIGTWTDNGDSSITFDFVGIDGRPARIVFFFDNDALQAGEYPAFYGQAGITMRRPDIATPLPPATETPRPVLSPTPVAPDSKPSSSLPCGSAVLAPLVVGMWLINKRRYTE